MKGLLKLITGLAVGAAIGAALYLMLTNEDEQGLLHDVKGLARDVMEEGKRAAAARRMELEAELGQHPSA